MRTLHGKTAIVTGAGRGIGREIALLLAGNGVRVIMIDKDAESVAATAHDAGRFGEGARAVTLDLGVPADIEAFFDDLQARQELPYILVNNAAVSQQVDFFDLVPDTIDRILGVNMRGTLLMMQGAARLMRSSGDGRIVNMSSIAGKGFRHTSNIAYAGSKGGIIAMTRIAAARLGEFGITVNTVCPGITETDMMADWLKTRAAESNSSVSEVRGRMVEGSALRRVNDANDVAQTVLFLVSEAGRNITGQSINVDAGTIWD